MLVLVALAAPQPVVAQTPAEPPAQQTQAAAAAEPQSNASQQPAQSQPASSERIIDEPMRPGVGKKIARIPLYPFIGLGNAFEKGLLAFEKHNVQIRLAHSQRVLAEHHTQLLFGGLGVGSGMAFGVNFFDDSFFHPNIRFDMPLRYSTGRYQQYEPTLNIALAENRALFFEVGWRFRARPKEDFFGLGPGSLEGDRSDYQLQDRRLHVAIGSQIRGTRIQADAAYVNSGTSLGNDNLYPDTSVVFPTLPGLGRNASLVRWGLTGVHPHLDNEFDPHRGYRLRGHWHRNDSLNSANFNFFEYGGSGELYVPLGGPRTLALRGIGDFRSGRNGGVVPFYVLPFLGGSKTMRGFREFRFHDNNAVLFNTEFRWRIWKLVDAVLFTDQGQVAARIRDMSLGNFEHSYGGGFRFRTTRGVMLRFDIASSREGPRYYIQFSPEF